eukprot:922072-Prymnesium_polylepis.1
MKKTGAVRASAPRLDQEAPRPYCFASVRLPERSARGGRHLQSPLPPPGGGAYSPPRRRQKINCIVPATRQPGTKKP